MKNLIPHPRSTHVSYFWWSLPREKWEIHEKHDYNHIFSCISHFSYSKVHRKYVTWVFCIQWVLPLKIWVKNYGDKLKIRVEKVVLLFFNIFTFLLQKWWIIPHCWHHHLESYWFLSNLFWLYIFLRRSILDLKIPLMWILEIQFSYFLL